MGTLTQASRFPGVAFTRLDLLARRTSARVERTPGSKDHKEFDRRVFRKYHETNGP
jgi:hypothetical protein